MDRQVPQTNKINRHFSSFQVAVGIKEKSLNRAKRRLRRRQYRSNKNFGRKKITKKAKARKIGYSCALNAA